MVLFRFWFAGYMLYEGQFQTFSLTSDEAQIELVQPIIRVLKASYFNNVKNFGKQILEIPEISKFDWKISKFRD